MELLQRYSVVMLKDQVIVNSVLNMMDFLSCSLLL